MSDKELEKELESLRAEIAGLTKARAKQRKKEAVSEAEAVQPLAQAAVTAAVEAAAIDVNDPDAVQGQMDKLLEQLEHEVRDLPAVTSLAVFSLGVLFGRLLR